MIGRRAKPGSVAPVSSATLLRAVRLRHVEGGRVEVQAVATGELLFVDRLRAVARWLDLCGHHWVPGSNGVWAR